MRVRGRRARERDRQTDRETEREREEREGAEEGVEASIVFPVIDILNYYHISLKHPETAIKDTKGNRIIFGEKTTTTNKQTNKNKDKTNSRTPTQQQKGMLFQSTF